MDTMKTGILEGNAKDSRLVAAVIWWTLTAFHCTGLC